MTTKAFEPRVATFVCIWCLGEFAVADGWTIPGPGDPIILCPRCAARYRGVDEESKEPS